MVNVRTLKYLKGDGNELMKQKYNRLILAHIAVLRHNVEQQDHINYLEEQLKNMREVLLDKNQLTELIEI
jgi:hypothetical protein